ncbi:hypothetical protein B0H63DRAFT_463366 [Podospora didyma]|uniref:Uncharacterized protein n=1 Tax=Podospora didyma TaxID=330526 RepID=A0AAE0NX11_9PEZI|nr:hypothetical protein B0H63DRAFT_463366 [Podospora didyma]
MQSQSMGSYRSLALLAVSSSPRDKNRVAKRHYFFFVLAILVFVGVAVGGYFGHLAMKNAMDAEAAAAAAKYSALLPPSPTHHDADSALTTQPPASAPSAIPPPEHPIPMKKGTSLGVAGYVVFGSGVLALYFQGPDTAVYTMVYRSDIGERVFSAGQGAKPIPEGWSDPQPLQIWPSGRTHLAPMALLNAPDTEPDTHLFLTDNGTLHDVVASINLNGSLGSSPFLSPTIETQSLSIATGGSVAAYWPWVVYQGPDGSLFELYNAQQVPAHSPTDTWSPRPLNISAKPGTRLALAPLFSTLNIDRTSKAGYALIYQATDGHLMVDVPDDRVVQNIASDSYYNYIKDGSGWLKAFPNDTIDSPGAVASLSLARFNDTNSRMFTFILYVNDQHDIAVLSNHKKTGWMLSMPSTLQGVDPDTNIACHTLSKSFSVDATSFVDKTLARCYFQRNGQLIEVEYNDEEESWVVLAYYDNGQMHNWYGTGMQGAGATDMPKASATSPEGSHTRASIASITPAAAETHTGNPATPPPTGQPAGQSPGKPTGQPAGSPAGQPTGPPVGQPTAQPAGSPAGQPAGSAPGQPTGPPTGPPAGTRVGTRVEQSAGQPARSHPAQPTVPSAGKPTGLPAGSTSGQSSGQPTLPPAGQPFISSAG